MIKLGSKYIDKVSGKLGLAVGRREYLAGHGETASTHEVMLQFDTPAICLWRDVGEVAQQPSKAPCPPPGQGTVQMTALLRAEATPNSLQSEP